MSTTASAQDRRAPTIDDLLNLVQVSAAEISPDGKQVIYAKSELKKWSDNKRVSSIWIANSDGTDHRQLLGSDKDRSPQWSPDGTRLAHAPLAPPGLGAPRARADRARRPRRRDRPADRLGVLTPGYCRGRGGAGIVTFQTSTAFRPAPSAKSPATPQ